MVSLEEGIFDFLSNHKPITDLVGVGGDARIYPLRMPKDIHEILPAIVYRKISGVRELAHTGSSELVRTRVQFSCYSSENYLEAKAIALQIIKLFTGFKGLLKDVPVQCTLIELELDQDDEGTNLYLTVVDVTFWHEERIP